MNISAELGLRHIMQHSVKGWTLFGHKSCSAPRGECQLTPPPTHTLLAYCLWLRIRFGRVAYSNFWFQFSHSKWCNKIHVSLAQPPYRYLQPAPPTPLPTRTPPRVKWVFLAANFLAIECTDWFGAGCLVVPPPSMINGRRHLFIGVIANPTWKHNLHTCRRCCLAVIHHLLRVTRDAPQRQCQQGRRNQRHKQRRRRRRRPRRDKWKQNQTICQREWSHLLSIIKLVFIAESGSTRAHGRKGGCSNAGKSHRQSSRRSSATTTNPAQTPSSFCVCQSNKQCAGKNKRRPVGWRGWTRREGWRLQENTQCQGNKS